MEQNIYDLVYNYLFEAMTAIEETFNPDHECPEGVKMREQVAAQQTITLIQDGITKDTYKKRIDKGLEACRIRVGLE